MPPTKDHDYDAPKEQPNGDTVAICSRCGATKRRVVERLHPQGFLLVHRMSEDGLGFAGELPCTPIEKLFTLARGGKGSEEKSAALRAVHIMAEHNLVFYPDTPLLKTAIAAFSTASVDDLRRKAAHSIALASKDLHIVTVAEREQLHRNDRAPRDTEERVRATTKKALGFGQQLLSMLAGQIEIDEGVTLKDKADELRAEWASITREAMAVRAEAERFVGRKKPDEAPIEPAPKPKAKAKPTKKSPPRKTTPAPVRKKGRSR